MHDASLYGVEGDDERVLRWMYRRQYLNAHVKAAVRTPGDSENEQAPGSNTGIVGIVGREREIAVVELNRQFPRVPLFCIRWRRLRSSRTGFDLAPQLLKLLAPSNASRLIKCVVKRMVLILSSSRDSRAMFF
jgi:hypothetical protein